MTTPNLSALPPGASVRFTFEGVLLKGDLDSQAVELMFNGDPSDAVKVSWGQGVNLNEDFVPEVTVLDYSFRVGDVATIRVEEQHGFRWETLFAVKDHSKDGFGWLDQYGTQRTPDLADLTLVMRDGFPVPTGD